MQITETMTIEEIYAYREWSGCSMQEIARKQRKLYILRRVLEADSVPALRNVLEEMVHHLYP